MSYKISRRTALKGLGVSIPLPFMNIMAAQKKSAVKNDQKFVAVFKPNGVFPPAWEINGGTEDSFELSSFMKPMERHKKDLLIVSNMGNSGFSSHQASAKRFLSSSANNKNLSSIDQLIAQKIGGGTPVRSLELTTEGLFAAKPECSFISYDEKGRPIPRHKNPRAIFNQLFCNPLHTKSGKAEFGSILDNVRSDINALNRKTGREDRSILDEYLTTLRETEKKIQNSKPFSSESIDQQRYQKADINIDERMDMLFEIMAIALWTDTTRCMSLMMGNSNSRHMFDHLGVTSEHHYLSHFFRNFSKQNVLDLVKINIWHSQKFARFLDLLKSFKDKDGPIYNKTLVLYGSGMGHSDSHSAYKIPTLLTGGVDMIKTGRHIYPAKEVPLSDLHLTIVQKFGVEMNSLCGRTSTVGGFKDSNYERYVEPSYDGWVKQEGNKLSVQGRLRISSNYEEANIYYIDMNEKPPVKLEVTFKDKQKYQMPSKCGKVVHVEGIFKSAAPILTLTKPGSIKLVD